MNRALKTPPPSGPLFPRRRSGERVRERGIFDVWPGVRCPRYAEHVKMPPLPGPLLPRRRGSSAQRVCKGYSTLDLASAVAFTNMRGQRI
jgi:hypothetical protein